MSPTRVTFMHIKTSFETSYPHGIPVTFCKISLRPHTHSGPAILGRSAWTAISQKSYRYVGERNDNLRGVVSLREELH